MVSRWMRFSTGSSAYSGRDLWNAGTPLSRLGRVGTMGHNPRIEMNCISGSEPGMVAYQVIGKPLGRIVDGEEKVTGTARYAADILLEGTLYGMSLKSPY